MNAVSFENRCATNTACTAGDPGSGNILDLQYNFNLGSGDNGNVMGITNNRNTARTQSLAYDQLNRLTTAQTQGTSGSDCFGFQFTYDEWANLTGTSILSGYTSCSGTTPYALSVSVNGNNQITTSGFSYDASGDSLTDGFNIYAWNAEGEIKSAAGVNYTYDGDGNRLEKSSGKIYWYGAGTEILDESDSSGNFTNEYVFFGGKRIAMRVVSSGTIYYYEADMLGSARTMVQAGQTSVCFDADFLPYGQEVDYTNTCGSNYKFEGKERDTETDNDDFGARYYRSALGRWLSADWSSVPAPVPYANLANPQTLNLYAMVSDNPETFADLDGHCSMDQEVCETGPTIGGPTDPGSTNKNVCNAETGKCDSARTNVNGNDQDKAQQQMDAAGMKAETSAVNLTRQSIRNGHAAEYGGLIIKTHGRITATEPIRGENGSFDPTKVHVPKGATIVGMYHTHPESRALEGEGPSPQDVYYLRTSARASWVGYVAGSYSGIVRRYTESEPVKGPFDTTIYGTKVGVVPCPASNGGTCQ